VTIFDFMDPAIPTSDYEDDALKGFVRDFKSRTGGNVGSTFSEFYALLIHMRFLARNCGFDLVDSFSDLNTTIDAGIFPDPTTDFDPFND
jgi:hypothetical protein